MNWPATTIVREKGRLILETLSPGKHAKGGWEYEEYFPRKIFRDHLFSDEAMKKAEDALEVRPPGKKAVRAAVEAAYDHAIARMEE